LFSFRYFEIQHGIVSEETLSVLKELAALKIGSKFPRNLEIFAQKQQSFLLQ
jgi:hypothetical protein